MRKFVCTLALVLVPVLALAADATDAGGPEWAFPIANPNAPPPVPDNGMPKSVPGSAKMYTQAQIDNAFGPPDWFPDEHPVPPDIVMHGRMPNVRACGQCHMMTGAGHPESSGLAGLTVDYQVQQLKDFKSGARKSPWPAMNDIAKDMTDDEMKAASTYFAGLKAPQWIKVMESATAPKSYVGRGQARWPAQDGGTEPLGNRIIELTVDAARGMARDPHAGFVAYVPVGSVKKGEALVTTGGGGKTFQCAICHGPDLKGLGDVPHIAGRSPVYLFRQLSEIKNGTRGGDSPVLMKAVVAKLSDDDMLNIAAYLASRQP